LLQLSLSGATRLGVGPLLCRLFEQVKGQRFELRFWKRADHLDNEVKQGAHGCIGCVTPRAISARVAVRDRHSRIAADRQGLLRWIA
jgi:hypothetical protein